MAGVTVPNTTAVMGVLACAIGLGLTLLRSPVLVFMRLQAAGGTAQPALFRAGFRV